MKKAFVAIPSGPTVHRSVFRAAVSVLRDTPSCAVEVATDEGLVAFSAKNAMAEVFLQGDADYLIYIDGDNPPLKNPIDLVDLEADVIGLPTPIHRGDLADKGQFPIVWNVRAPDGKFYARPPSGSRPDQLYEVEAVGAGCLVLSRRVVEAVRPLFLWRLDETSGRVVEGDDFHFCRRARELGFQIHTHWGYPCEHFRGEVGLLTVLSLHDKAVKEATRASHIEGAKT